MKDIPPNGKSKIAIKDLVNDFGDFREGDGLDLEINKREVWFLEIPGAVEIELDLGEFTRLSPL